MFFLIICYCKSPRFFPGLLDNLLFANLIFSRESQGVRACCNPVPLLVHHNLHDIHQIILQVRDIPLIEVNHSFVAMHIDKTWCLGTEGTTISTIDIAGTL